MTSTSDALILKSGFDAGHAAATAETELHAVFLGSSRSLRVNYKYTVPEKSIFGIGYRNGYAAAISSKKIRVNGLGEVTSVVEE
jgi:hypothetical protein